MGAIRTILWNVIDLVRLRPGDSSRDAGLGAQLAALVPAVHNMYGPTEATVWAATHPVPREPAVATVPIGRPMANVRAYVVDRELRLVPTGAPGELLLGERNRSDLKEKDMQKIRGNQVAMIFQEPMTALNPVYTIGFQISETILTHRPGMTRKQAKARAIELLGLVQAG